MDTMTMAPPTTAPVAVPHEPTTPIRPSEAIRLGCLRSRPTSGDWYDWDSDGNLLACALGAMMLGFGDDPEKATGDAVIEQMVPVEMARARCPEADCYMDPWEPPASEMVMHLNDGHGWPRERIADWLAGLGL